MSSAVLERLTVVSMMLVVVAVAAVGQLLLKTGISQALHGARITGLDDYVRVFCQPRVLGGLCCYVLNLGLYFAVLSRARLGLAYPLVATNYLFVTLLAWRFLGEQIGRQQILGLAIILFGVVVFATQPDPPSSATATVPPAAAPAEPAAAQTGQPVDDQGG